MIWFNETIASPHCLIPV